MKLSDTEIYMVEKLRKRQQQFRRWRFPMLALFCALTIACFVLLVEVYRFPSDNIHMKLLVAAYYLPPLYGFLALCAFQVGRFWRGDHESEVLLRLIDEAQSREA